MDSDDDDTFVTIGTALPVYEENEAPKKPIKIQEQTVKDSKGRQRFHGAFTGGFSAGYFNTVSTPEGWTPSTFVSSRNQKPGETQQRPEDFMDEEDLGEHGIAPRTVGTSSNFTPAVRQDKKRRADNVFNDGVIPGQPALQDLIVPHSIPMGIRLLRKMGWREGQGVGPRVKKKSKAKKKSSAAGQKVYGCAMPLSSGESEDSDDEHARNFTFAPKDTNPIKFESKDNLHGLGYRGLDTRSVLGHVSVMPAKPVRGNVRKGFSGQAFGVGAFEDEDEDIYGQDHMSNYHKTLGGDDDKDSFGWTAPKHRPAASNVPAIGYIATVLEGFSLSTKQCKAKKMYPAPQLPRGFIPSRNPAALKSSRWNTQPKPKSDAEEKPKFQRLTVSDRADALGEIPQIKSVFDLVSDKDKSKMDKILKSEANSDGAEQNTTITETQPSSSGFQSFKLNSGPLTEEPNKNMDFSSASPSGSSVESKKDTTVTGPQPTSSYGTAFKPFARYPAKQERYDKYMEYSKKGFKDAHNQLDKQGMTEWECQHEREEFSRASALFKPMNSLMASRFTHAEHEEDSATLPADKEEEQSEQAKAVELKMFGRLTRETYEWHPDKLLCKRFNIPNPYPDSTQIGLHKVKRDKFSVFNFLSFPSGSEPPPEPAPKLAQKQESKPLAVEYQSLTEPSVPSTSDETASSVTGQENMDSTEPYSQADDTQTERPPMDLFKAIFADSESDSSSESEDEDKGESHKDKNATESKTSENTDKNVNDSHIQHMEAESISQKQSDTLGSNLETEKRFPEITDVHSPESSPELQGASGRVGSTIEDTDKSVTIEYINEFVSGAGVTEQSKDYYGPSLPPDNQDGSSNTPSVTVINSDSSGVEVVYVEAAKKEKHHKKKHKYRYDKEKRMKKHKKSAKKSKKNKKEKKEKKKKKKHKKKEESSSSEGSSEESDNDETDKLLLDKLRSLPDTKRKSAADFM